MENWKFFCVTFGCKVNQYETQAVREAWEKEGGLECSDASQAQVVLVNSCAITARGERDARNALVRLRKENPLATLVLTGCAAHLVTGFVPRKDAPRPEADVVVAQEGKDSLVSPSFIRDLAERAKSARSEALSKPLGLSAEESLLGQRTLREGRSPIGPGRAYPNLAISDFSRERPVLKIQDGCSHRCTYCIVPLTRGAGVSRRPEEVIREAAVLFENHAEIMISGINLRLYGRDDASCGDFWDLLERLDDGLAPRFAERARLRISSLEPSQLKGRALEVLAKSHLVAPHLHISLQHASRNVLRRMGRGHYTAAMLQEACERIHEFWPVMGLGADIIVGFPGETPEDVDVLCRFIEDSHLTYAHVFPYSRRPGTPAASFPNQIQRSEKTARAKLVRDAVEKKRQAFWQSQLLLDVIEMAPDAAENLSHDGSLHGVSAHYVPCYVQASLLPADLATRRFLKVVPRAVTARGVLAEPVEDDEAPGARLLA